MTTEWDYPDDAELGTIANWDAVDLVGWFEYIFSSWHWPEYCKREDEGEIAVYKMSTGGWSGNEDIIHAMRQNWAAWALTFYSETRGGHFVFKFKLMGEP